MLVQLRKVLLLGASVLLVLALGGMAAWGQWATADHVDRTHRADRLRLQQTLAGLTGQYLQFTFLDTLRAADSVRWSLRAHDPGDARALERVVTSSPLASFGATLVSTTGEPLTSYAPRGVPSAADPGLAPLRAALLAGQPGLSDVMDVHGAPVVAFAVPVRRGPVVAAVFLAYADARTWPLQGYDRSLQLGATAEPYVLDSHGVVAASGVPGTVGHRLSALPGRVTGGGSGLFTQTRNHQAQVVSYGPAGHGWTAVTLQDASAFAGGVQSSRHRQTLLLVALLTLVVLLLAWFTHAREHALRRLAEERLHDPLTGLAQRRLFQLKLDSAVARLRRSGSPLAVLYCDLDGFKAINDTYGHNNGDKALVAVAHRIQEATREVDLVARIGGDEFAVVVEGTSLDEVRGLAARVRASVSRELSIGSTVLHPTVTVGGAVLHDATRADDLLPAADMAMYQVKHHLAAESLVVLDATAPDDVAPTRPLSGDKIPAQAGPPSE